MSKPRLGQTILSKTRQSREDRMIEQASSKFAVLAEESQADVEPVSEPLSNNMGGKVSVSNGQVSVDSYASQALANLASVLGAKVGGKSISKDYLGYKMTITHIGNNNRNANFEFVMAKEGSVGLKMTFSSYADGSGKPSINTYRLSDAYQVGEQAYSLGFPIDKDILVAINMIKLDMKKSSGSIYG